VHSGTTDLCSCKTVTAANRLLVNDPQVFSNEADGQRLLFEAKKLRVSNVSSSPPPQYRLGKKALPPQGDQAAGVKVLRMQAPDPHRY